MKKNIISFLLAAFFILCNASFSSAKIKIPVCFPCENMEMIKVIPTGSEITKFMGQKVNISYVYKEYGVLWISFWNEGGRYVLSNTTNSAYFEIDEETATLLKMDQNFDVHSSSPLSFWKKMGGKLILGLILLLIIWGQLKPRNKSSQNN